MKQFYSFILSLLLVLPLMAETDIHWRKLNTANTSFGLPSDMVTSLTFGNDGTLYVATDVAIAKLKNDDWHTFNESDGMNWGKSTTDRIINDSKGNIWFCSPEKGLARLDSKEEFTLYDADQGGTIASNNVTDVVEDGKGGYYIANSARFSTCLSHINAKGEWQHYNFNILSSNPFNIILCMVVDKHTGTLFVGTLFEGIKRFDGEKFVGLSEDYQIPISQMLIDDKRHLYAASDNGLMCVSLDTDYTIHMYTKADGLADNFTSCLSRDAKGKIWAGTDGKGISIINGKEIQIINRENGLSSNTINEIAFDSNGNPWIATKDAGISYFDGKKWQHIGATGLASNNVNSILFYGDRTWYATNAGLSLEENGKWSVFRFAENDNKHFAKDYIASLFRDNRKGTNALFVSGYGGIARLDLDSKNWKNYSFSTKDKEGNVKYPKLNLKQLSNGDLWVTTFGEKLGIAKFNDKTGDFTFYNDQNLSVLPKACNSFFGLEEAPDGSVWFCSVDGALILKDGKWKMKKFESNFMYKDPDTGEEIPAQDNNVRTVTFAPDGKVWIGKISGIMIYDPITDKRIQERGTEETKTEFLTQISFDKYGNTIMSTLFDGIFIRNRKGEYFHLKDGYGLEDIRSVYNTYFHNGQWILATDQGVYATSDYNVIVEECSGIQDLIQQKSYNTVYNLKGQRMTMPISLLPKGIYVSNGKRFYIK